MCVTVATRCCTLHTYFEHCLHACSHSVFSPLVKVCFCVMCVFRAVFHVSVQSVRPHLASHYFYPCSCMTELILKALFLAQNIPSCLCTVPSRPIHSSLSKTLAVICCFLYTHPFLPPPSSSCSFTFSLSPSLIVHEV